MVPTALTGRSSRGLWCLTRPADVYRPQQFFPAVSRSHPCWPTIIDTTETFDQVQTMDPESPVAPRASETSPREK